MLTHDDVNLAAESTANASESLLRLVTVFLTRPLRA